MPVISFEYNSSLFNFLKWLSLMLCSYPLEHVGVTIKQTDPLADSLEMSGQSHGLGFSHSETIGFASFVLSETLAVCESKRP